MNHDDFDNLDDFIDSALREERNRNVPFGFHRNVEENLRIAAAIQVERSKYRLALLIGVSFYTLLFGSATLYMILGAIFTSIGDTMPAFLSYYDQFSLAVSLWWTELAAFSGLLTSVGVWTLYRLKDQRSSEF